MSGAAPVTQTADHSESFHTRKSLKTNRFRVVDIGLGPYLHAVTVEAH